MKNIFLLLLSFSLVFLSCKKDNPTIELRYDADNFSAPELPSGTFDAAQLFPKNITDNYIGRKLESVEFYIQDKPDDCEILIFGENNSTSPGGLIYSKNVINQVGANSWNTHVLDTPVEIKNEDLWIAVRIVHTSDIRSIGCDAGPARTNGDWMLGEGNNEWRTYRDISNQAVDINWNIRGILSQE